MVKYWRCFAQLLETTGRCIRGEHFTKEAIESCGLQSRVLEDEKDSKDAPTLPKLSDSTYTLAWIVNATKVFAQMIDDDNLPLGYVICRDAIVDADP